MMILSKKFTDVLHISLMLLYLLVNRRSINKKMQNILIPARHHFRVDKQARNSAHIAFIRLGQIRDASQRNQSMRAFDEAQADFNLQNCSKMESFTNSSIYIAMNFCLFYPLPDIVVKFSFSVDECSQFFVIKYGNT